MCQQGEAEAAATRRDRRAQPLHHEALHHRLSIRYARGDDGAHLAYSVVGDAALDLVYVGGYTISIDSFDDEPDLAQMWRRLVSFSRLIRYDARGIGLSDPIDPLHPPTVGDAVSDLLAILDAARNVFVPVELGRYLAEHIAGAAYVEIDSADNAMWGLDTDEFIDAIEEFATGERTHATERVLATILFSDIVGSTERAVALGDRAWRALLDAHDTIVRAELARYGGREVNTTGDGFVAAFDSPTRAVECGRAIVAAAAAAQIEVRVGIHTGECERRGDDLAGLAVHIAARVGALAEPGEVLASRTVRDLVGGSELRFTDRGKHELKGIPDAWELFALEPGGPFRR